jgi:aspartyl/asparaginyl beta-hydroxylase (cupin superfamily)
MNTAAAQNQGLVKEAVSALQAGDSKRAREVFERVVASADADAASWLGLAFACAQLGDDTATLKAVDKALELEPGNLRAIIFKADHLENNAEPDEALKFYQHALRLGAKAAHLPDDVIQGLQRAQKACARKDDEYKSFLIEKMKAGGFESGPDSRRFQESLDIIFGSKEVFYQEPRRYYFPGLPQVQFYEREQFDWIEEIEAATNDIRSELKAVMSGRSKFKPYLQIDETHLNSDDDSLANSNDWGALFLWDYGRLVPENAKLFPKTVKALEVAPLPAIPGQAPMALFSKLTPGTKIPPHNGLMNTRLICHLPIIVPENCGALRVGNEERPWVEGEMLIFDDSIEHEAWNTSNKERVVLLFEVWRPELKGEERDLVSTMLAAVKEYYMD